MVERYSKLFSLHENLYVEGSPVIIVAGALHKDNQTGGIFAQLKFKSIQDKAIKAIKVSFTTFDSFGNQLDEPYEFQYLDLDIKRNDVFGNKIPVYFTNANVRSYSVQIKEVAFADGSFGEPTGTVYETLPQQKTLSDTLGNSELVKQYTLDVGNNHSKFEPITHKDLWLCACGEYNRIGEACHRCNAVYDNLVGFDLKKLEENMSERLAEEDRLAEISRKNLILAEGMQRFNSHRFEQAIEVFEKIPGWADADEMIVKCQNAITEREEKAKAAAIAQKIREKKRKHRIKVAIGILISLLVVAAIAAYIIFGYMPKLNTYNQAVSLMESGSYEQAIRILNKVIEFKDSETQIENCNTAIKQRTYDTAVSLMEDGSYEEAIQVFNQVIEFKDSETQIENCNTAIKQRTYDTALSLMEDEAYQEAIALFEQIPDFLDSQEIVEAYYSVKYDYVKNHYNNTDTTTYSYLKELKSSKYLDSAELYDELYSWKATIVVNSKEYDFNTDKSSIKRGKPVYFNVKLSGGPPVATKLSYTIHYPGGTSAKRQWGGVYSTGSRISFGWDAYNGLTGTLRITVYDGNGNIIGTHSVKITN